MKKLYSILLALGLLVGGVNVAHAYSSDGNPNLKDESTATPADPVRVYRLVRYPENQVDSVTLSAGDVVVWDCVSDDGVSVTLVSSANSTDAVAGVVVSPFIPTADSSNSAANSIGRRNWGYVQTSGLCTVANVTSGGAAGTALRASQTARYATAATVTPTGTTQRIMGFAYDASSQGQAEVYVDLR